ncbi:hypothetical protein, partial [Burkholderia sp. TSV86]|uniref:hypothetical protein n=1 Tax=Burkholderia sp. TSV86 TaxID=1385594 RepID=UPI001E37B1BE
YGSFHTEKVRRKLDYIMALFAGGRSTSRNPPSRAGKVGGQHGRRSAGFDRRRVTECPCAEMRVRTANVQADGRHASQNACDAWMKTLDARTETMAAAPAAPSAARGVT